MRIIVLLPIVLALLLMPTIALAECTQITVMGPDGSMKLCQSCCVGNQCQVTCF